MGKCVRFVIEVYRFDNFLKVIKSFIIKPIASTADINTKW